MTVNLKTQWLIIPIKVHNWKLVFFSKLCFKFLSYYYFTVLYSSTRPAGNILRTHLYIYFKKVGNAVQEDWNWDFLISVEKKESSSVENNTLFSTWEFILLT